MDCKMDVQSAWLFSRLTWNKKLLSPVNGTLRAIEGVRFQEKEREKKKGESAKDGRKERINLMPSSRLQIDLKAKMPFNKTI